MLASVDIIGPANYYLTSSMQSRVTIPTHERVRPNIEQNSDDDQVACGMVAASTSGT